MKRILVLMLVMVLSSNVSAKTLAGMLGDFRAAVGEQKVSTSSVEDSTVTRWVNEGMNWVASQLEPLEKDTAIIAPDSFATITMPVTFKMMRGAISQGQGALVKVTMEQFGIIADTGYGTWMAHGRVVEIKAKELEAGLDSIKLFYYARPASVSDTGDTVEIDDIFHPLVIDFAISRFESSRHFIQTSIAIRQLAGSDLEKARQSRIAIIQSE